MAAYEFPILADLGKSVAEVGAIVDHLNSNLATFGVAERIGLEGEIGAMTLTAGRDLSPEEEERVRQMLYEELSKALPDLSLRVGAPRRKTGKSGNQSAAS